MKFLNGFGSKMAYKHQGELMSRLEQTLRLTSHLCEKTLLDVDFLEATSVDGERLTISEVIHRSWVTISKCSDVDLVVASKILHAINPELFVMWDTKIIVKHGAISISFRYSDRFLPKMQQLAECAISQIMDAESISRESAIDSLTRCSHSLARVLDEYNFVLTR